MTDHHTTTLSSRSRTVHIHRDLPTVIIGERINPTGRKTLQSEMENHRFDAVKTDAVAQVRSGAAVLDVNAGVPGGDEPALLREAVRAVMSATDVPICIDTANPEALAAALEVYEGKPLVNSVTGESRSLDSMLPLVQAHGAAVIGLCMDDDGIPGRPEGRLAVAEKIVERAAALGIPAEDVVIDPLVLTVGTDSEAAAVTLEAARRISSALGANIAMGASNVSFGLPDRRSLNAAFIAIAICAGLNCPITNPLDPDVTTAVFAADLLLGKDEWGERWIAAYRSRRPPP
jgi:5-methyltetrahydrofolate--homocysteine methyltransferase